MGFLQYLLHEISKEGRPFPEEVSESMGELVHVGGTLSEESVLKAYGRGCFPWTGESPIPWHSPDPRLVLFPQNFKASKNLRKLARSQRFRVAFDVDYLRIMKWCALVPRPGQNGTWITPNMMDVYGALFRRGIGHCVAVYDADVLVGGLYGLSIGGVFFGESMFAKKANTSKLALYALCQNLAHRGFHMVDCQQVTPHLLSLGATPIPRRKYLKDLKEAIGDEAKQGAWTHWQFPLNPESDELEKAGTL